IGIEHGYRLAFAGFIQDEQGAHQPPTLSDQRPWQRSRAPRRSGARREDAPARQLARIPAPQRCNASAWDCPDVDDRARICGFPNSARDVDAV
ncbi:MAG TPA: hypothetical protein VL178_06805, partial [Pseudomonas sp.]|nr:hypothetical protein [Pseudomonas sp.]